MAPRRLVLFTEGLGDVPASRTLVDRLLKSLDPAPWDCLWLDPNPFKLGGIHAITGRVANQWTMKIEAALKRKNVGAILTVLDGDADDVAGKPFCAYDVAADLAKRARLVGAGQTFSLAVVFAMKEFESWIIAGAASVAGRALPDGRIGLKPEARAPDGNIENIRDAKRWLSERMSLGYKPTEHQNSLTAMMDLAEVRGRALPSFLRLERAIGQLVTAVRDGRHIATPPSP